LQALFELIKDINKSLCFIKMMLVVNYLNIETIPWVLLCQQREGVNNLGIINQYRLVIINTSTNAKRFASQHNT